MNVSELIQLSPSPVRSEVIRALLECVRKIGEVQTHLFQVETRRREHEFTLKDQEARLLSHEGGPIDGKNAEVRAAQLYMLTAPERAILLDLDAQVADAKGALNVVQATHRSLLAIAGLLSGAPDTGGDAG